MTRCPTHHADGRQCTLLSGHTGTHLVTTEPVTAEAAMRIATRWGIPQEWVAAVGRGIAGGPPHTVDQFVDKNFKMLDAILRGVGRAK